MPESSPTRWGTPKSGHVSRPPCPPLSLLPFSLNHCNPTSHSRAHQPVLSHLRDTVLYRTQMDHVPFSLNSYGSCWIHWPLTWLISFVGVELPAPWASCHPPSSPFTATAFSHTVLHIFFRRSSGSNSSSEKRHETHIFPMFLEFGGTLYNINN